jgi:isoquinoline 1-oxidoreductase beta subunit
MENKAKINRRNFLLSSPSAVSGLLLAFHLPAKSQVLTVEKSAKTFAPNAFLNISPDNKITIWVTRSEMGQGVRTALPIRPYRRGVRR